MDGGRRQDVGGRGAAESVASAETERQLTASRAGRPSGRVPFRDGLLAQGARHGRPSRNAPETTCCELRWRRPLLRPPRTHARCSSPPACVRGEEVGERPDWDASIPSEQGSGQPHNNNKIKIFFKFFKF